MTIQIDDSAINFVTRLWELRKTRYFDQAAWEMALEAVEDLPCEQLGLLIAGDLDGRPGCIKTEFGQAWLNKAESATELLQRLAAMALVSRLPVFEHYCSDCRYLGKMKRQKDYHYYMDRNVQGEWADLYVCTVHGRPVVEVRYHDNKEHCFTGFHSNSNDPDPHLREGWRRFEGMKSSLVSR